MRIPTIFNTLFGNQTWNVSQTQKNVYLTFDDGPIPEVTPWVLELLKKKNIKATFFCIGHNIQKHPDVFKAIVDQGHRIGNHTFNHLNGWQTNTERYIDNTVLCQQEIEKHLRVETKLFRPAYGKITPRQIKALKKLGYQIIMWELLSQDYKTSLTAERCFKKATTGVRPGSIIVFHDSLKAQENLKGSLAQTIDYLLDQGYNFKTL